MTDYSMSGSTAVVRVLHLREGDTMPLIPGMEKLYRERVEDEDGEPLIELWVAVPQKSPTGEEATTIYTQTTIYEEEDDMLNLEPQHDDEYYYD